MVWKEQMQRRLPFDSRTHLEALIKRQVVDGARMRWQPASFAALAIKQNDGARMRAQCQ